jgi:hypothetical protein
MNADWEVAWTTLEPLTDREVERAVAVTGWLGCSLPDLKSEVIEGRYVCLTHREDPAFAFEFGFAHGAPDRPSCRPERGLAHYGEIAWNWCRTGRRQPLTDLVLRKLRQVQEVCGDKLLVWDDDGLAHWSWGSCPIEETGFDPERVIDAHLQRLPVEQLRRAS